MKIRHMPYPQRGIGRLPIGHRAVGTGWGRRRRSPYFDFGRSVNPVLTKGAGGGGGGQIMPPDFPTALYVRVGK